MQARTASSASRRDRIMGNMIPLTPTSRATLTATGSFHGTRRMGTVSVPFIAWRIACTMAMSAAACSPSMMRKSNPMRAITSATAGLPSRSHEP